MIGYDVRIKNKDKLNETSLPNVIFKGYKKESKAIYELAEYIWYFYKWEIIKESTLNELKNYLNNITDNNLIDENPNLQISRNNFQKKVFNEIPFKYTEVKYPLLVREFGNYEIVSEIKITEQQRAMATQPMLYLCFPITELKANENLLGRTAKTKEIAYFDITKKNISVFIEVLKLFGILSKNHQHDVLEIIKTII